MRMLKALTVVFVASLFCSFFTVPSWIECTPLLIFLCRERGKKVLPAVSWICIASKLQMQSSVERFEVLLNGPCYFSNEFLM